MTEGYYRYPTIHNDTVVFVAEDDLWIVPASGGVARRLTSNPGQASLPAFSPDGEWLAFTGSDEGHSEVYIMPAGGGEARRLTYLGGNTSVVGWTPTGDEIVFVSDTGQPFPAWYHVFTIGRNGGEPAQLPIGPAHSIAYGPTGGIVIARNATDIARWKRYRGGFTGDIWIDQAGEGEWRRLIDLDGNVAKPLWVGDRIYFVSDHEGIGNLYSCLPTGEDVRRHTNHDDYYVRHPSTDGRRIVYHAGADLYLFDPDAGRYELIGVEFRSPRVERQRKFVDADEYLQDADLHPEGHSVVITSRGKPFTMANWEGAVIQHGETNGARYRLTAWLNDGERLVTVSDAAGEEALEIHHANGETESHRIEGLDIGRPDTLVVSPTDDVVALSNHRHELILVNVKDETATVLDRSEYENVRGLAWSPDGHWVAYGLHIFDEVSVIKLCRVADGATFEVTKPVLRDVAPAFDPDGKYLYFLSYRDFNPIYDTMQFELSFPWGMRPYLITLQAKTPNPFVPEPRAPGAKIDNAEQKDENGSTSDDEDTREASKNDDDKVVQIDIEGITDRVAPFPVDAGLYGRIRGIKDKVLFSSYPLEGSLTRQWYSSGTPPAKGKIEIYDFSEQEHETLISGMTTFDVSRNAKTLIYRAGDKLRVLEAGKKPENGSSTPSRKSGWLNLDRIKVSVEPAAEWRQMFREAWRLQRNHFWTEDMAGVDWQEVYTRYLPLVDRIATRTEFSDLMWEMQGELGTSHAYVIGGDYPSRPYYRQGFLGADLDYDDQTESYRIAHIVQGDVWEPDEGSPLIGPGIDVREGDRLVAVNGRTVGRGTSPYELLVNHAGTNVRLTFERDREDGNAERQTITVETLRTETPARYREWVDANRRAVHEATDGRVGYIHVPDMGPRGFAEFHRGYLAEFERTALIVDVRFNGGGHVSSLLLEKLARRRLGYDVPRWGKPRPYPGESVLGPIVALTNERAGSDGDIFSHAFKMMDIGPLIGTRTWGGVIGIRHRASLVDGGITTQPEFSHWFEDVGWGVENYGTDPDIEVEIRPQEYAAGDDPQLARAIEEIQRLLDEQSPEVPEFEETPDRSLPALPALPEA